MPKTTRPFNRARRLQLFVLTPAAALLLGPFVEGAAAQSAPAPPPLDGEVLDPQGLRVADATVVLVLGDGGLIETVSGADGAFSFASVPPGAHTVTVVRDGFTPRTVEVEHAETGSDRLSIGLGIAFAENLTVVGQQQERSVQETEASVVVTTGSRLEAEGISDLYQLVDRTPNVGASFGNKGFAIRGIDQRGAGGGDGLLVSVKVDGATVQSNQGMFFGPYNTWDMGQVEIFRGPQSTQQGRNSLAGAIVLESADPVYDTLVKGRLSVGNLSSSQTSATVNAPLVENRVAFRVSVDRRRTDGWVTNPTRAEDDYDFRDAMNVRAKLRFDPAARFRGMLTYSYTDSRGGEDSIGLDRFPGERVNLSDERAEEGSEHGTGTLDLVYDFNRALSLESTTSLYNHDYLRYEDADQAPARSGALDYTIDNQWFTQEFGLRYAGEGVTGVFGMYYANLEDRDDAAFNGSGAVFGLPGTTVTAFFQTDEDTENTALFGEFDFLLTDAWTLTLGARYDNENRETRSNQGVRVTPPSPLFPETRSPDEILDASYNAFLPKAALTRQWTPGVATTVSWQRGYRAGGRSVAFISQQISDYSPEFTDNYELAFRAESPGGRWRSNSNLFYIDWRDQQVNVMTDLGNDLDTFTVNAGESTVYGFETQGEYWPAGGLNLYGSLGLVKTRFDEFVDDTLDLSGNAFPYAPNWSYTVGASWTAGAAWVGDLHVTAQDNYFSERENDPRFFVGKRTLLNTRVGYQRDRWGIFFVGRNLLDEDYLLQAWHQNSLFLRGRSGEPRTVSIELTVGS